MIVNRSAAVFFISSPASKTANECTNTHTHKNGIPALSPLYLALWVSPAGKARDFVVKEYFTAHTQKFILHLLSDLEVEGKEEKKEIVC